MKLNANWQVKATTIEPERCTIEDVIELPFDAFLYFEDHLLLDFDFLREHKDAMYYDSDGEHALLVLGKEHDDGIIVSTRGCSYAQYTAYVPGARQLLNAEIKQLADYIMREGTSHTTNGVWANTYDELYYHFGASVSDTNGMGQLLKEELEQRDEVAECILCEDCIEIGYHLEHCPACQQGGIEGAASVLSLVGCNVEDVHTAEPVLSDDRKNQLYGNMIAWICEHIHDDHELYDVLHINLNMSDKEITDHGIDYLSEYYSDTAEEEYESDEPIQTM